MLQYVLFGIASVAIIGYRLTVRNLIQMPVKLLIVEAMKHASGSNSTFGAWHLTVMMISPIGDPLEGLGLGVVVFEELTHRRLEIDDGLEDPR